MKEINKKFARDDVAQIAIMLRVMLQDVATLQKLYNTEDDTDDATIYLRACELLGSYQDLKPYLERLAQRCGMCCLFLK